jgi:hypothetical protein
VARTVPPSTTVETSSTVTTEPSMVTVRSLSTRAAGTELPVDGDGWDCDPLD